VSPLIEQLQDLVDQSGEYIQTIESRAGVGKDTIRRWVDGHPQSGCTGTRGPSILTFEAVLNALGYRLKIERAE
jgi:hypothetical protein